MVLFKILENGAIIVKYLVTDFSIPSFVFPFNNITYICHINNIIWYLSISYTHICIYDIYDIYHMIYDMILTNLWKYKLKKNLNFFALVSEAINWYAEMSFLHLYVYTYTTSCYISLQLFKDN